VILPLPYSQSSGPHCLDCQRDVRPNSAGPCSHRNESNAHSDTRQTISALSTDQRSSSISLSSTRRSPRRPGELENLERGPCQEVFCSDPWRDHGQRSQARRRFHRGAAGSGRSPRTQRAIEIRAAGSARSVFEPPFRRKRSSPSSTSPWLMANRSSAGGAIKAELVSPSC